MAIKVILDTDIGDDIDDALALGLILASPELELVGVTTVYANVHSRSQQARTILQIAGKKFRNIPVAAGCGAAMSSRPGPTQNLKAYLEDTPTNQHKTCLPESDLAKPDPRHAVDFLIETIMSSKGDIVPITIGAMTNLAMALVKEPRIATKIPRIIAMACEFKRGFAEWNIKCDVEAAALVFTSGIPIEVITWDIGNTAQFNTDHLKRFSGSKNPLSKILYASIEAWQNHHQNPANPPMPSLYDPMAVATLIQPELMSWKTGVVQVETQGQSTYGVTTFTEKKDGPHKVAWDVQRDKALGFYLDRVLAL